VTAAELTPDDSMPSLPQLVRAVVPLGLLVLVAVVYEEVRTFGLVNFDDPSYLSSNDVVQAGFTWAGVAWAFTTFHTGNWHPVTWLSFMADIDLFGRSPGGHHVVNVALHLANTLLVFHVLTSATRRPWRSALVAALFAVHPLHVESVAWISERKDLLSAFFGLAAIGAYVRYVRTRSRGWYLAVVALAAASLASKPMLVTLPALLLLLDRWPLGRSEPWRTLLVEKVPLVVLSGASSAVAIAAQSWGGAVSTLVSLSPAERVANAVASYGAYLWKAIWPTPLAVVYPHPAFTPAGLTATSVAAALVALVALCALAAWQRRARPYLAVGLAWYVVGLLPVIGFIQVGMQGMADRYTYLPLLGPFVAVAWALPERLPSAPKIAVAAGCTLVVVALALVARVQTSYWSDSLTLFEHALSVTQDNATALRNAGVAHIERREYERGIAMLRQSLRVVPGDAWAWMDLGIALSTIGATDEASAAFREAFRLQPGDETVLFNVGIFAARQGDLAFVRQVHERLRQRDARLADELATLAGLTATRTDR